MSVLKMKASRKTNPRIVSLIERLRREDAPVWKEIARRLASPRKNYAEVNVSRINRYTKEGDVVVVPGTVLGAGSIDHGVTVGALKFSKTAIEKIERAGGTCLTIEEMLEKKPKGIIVMR